jgi:hypothetical protein
MRTELNYVVSRDSSYFFMGWTTWESDFDSQQGQRCFSSAQCPKWFWPLPNLLSSGYGVIFYGVKRPGRESNHSPPSTSHAKNERSYISIPPYAFMLWYLSIMIILQIILLLLLLLVVVVVVLVKNSVALVRKRTIPIERPPHAGEVGANFCW